jgi:CDP-glucose 4,6-dehydratase
MENMVKSNFWKDRKVFITGHTGFKGAWLSLWLHHLGAEVVGYALEPPTTPNFFDLCNLSEIIKSIKGDVRNFDFLKKSLAANKPDIVFHMAAQSLVRQSYYDPIETYSTNVMGTVNLLEAIRQIEIIRAVVIVTSDKCYENREWVWGYRENEAMGGYDPYSSSKGSSELITAAYRQSYFSPDDYNQHKVGIASVRAGNIIGGGDWGKDRLIPDCIRSLADNKEILIRNPQAIRPWQDVFDPLRGYLLLAEKLYQNGDHYAQAWNFGPSEDNAIPVYKIVQLILKYWGGGSWKDVSNSESKQLHEARYLKLDCSKARAELGWESIINIEESIKWTCEWYMKYYNNKIPMRDFSLGRLNRYLKLRTSSS